jgi:hypothetical protein
VVPVKDKMLANCCICGRRFSVDFLVATHIKKRAACTDSKRRDFEHVAAPMCKGGCDALFESGYIIVDESATIRVGRRELSSAGVTDLMQQVVGKR